MKIEDLILIVNINKDIIELNWNGLLVEDTVLGYFIDYLQLIILIKHKNFRILSFGIWCCRYFFWF